MILPPRTFRRCLSVGVVRVAVGVVRVVVGVVRVAVGVVRVAVGVVRVAKLIQCSFEVQSAIKIKEKWRSRSMHRLI